MFTYCVPPTALTAMAIAIVLGIIFALIEQNPKIRLFVPSSTGLSLGLLLPFSSVSTIFVGGVLGLLWYAISPRSANVYLVPLASGFIAGEALMGLVTATFNFFEKPLPRVVAVV